MSTNNNNVTRQQHYFTGIALLLKLLYNIPTRRLLLDSIAIKSKWKMCVRNHLQLLVLIIPS